MAVKAAAVEVGVAAAAVAVDEVAAAGVEDKAVKAPKAVRRRNSLGPLSPMFGSLVSLPQERVLGQEWVLLWAESTATL